MRVKSIKFDGVRNFEDEVRFDFSEAKPLTTISGKNGSGKTTVFKSLLICQRAFFIEQLTSDLKESLTKSLNQELKKYFTRKGAFIEVQFKFDNELEFEYSFKVSCTNFFSQYIEWEIVCSDEAFLTIKKHWNLINPSEIIVFIDSDKHFFEKNITYDNISVRTQTRNQLLIDSILNPENSFSNVYQSLVNDYIKERLVPERPRADIYLIPTKIFVQYLLPNITISNFSGQQLVNQFVLLSKTSKNEKSTFFDIRNFSSGEKALFYILLFINYIQRIGLLIIDEPENHFHEELLVKFIQLLNDIVSSADNVTVIKQIAKQIKFVLSKTNEEDFKKYYGSYKFSNIVLLTHSKNLIYNNFTNGSNFLLDGSLENIDYSNYEKSLREIGLSSIYSKVLFVEGTKDTQYLDIFFNEYNIKSHPLNGSGAVIDTYKRILQIKHYFKDYHFCFLIDRDTKTDEEIEKLKSENPSFFEDHFIVLERHEFENYLLDAEIFKRVLDKQVIEYPEISKMTIEEIKKKISEIAYSQKEIVIRKAVSNENWNSLNKLKKTYIDKKIPVLNYKAYNDYYNEILKKFDVSSFLSNEFESNFLNVSSALSEENWKNNWIKLCDGKIVLGLVVSYFAKHTKLDKERFLFELKREALQLPSNFEIKKLTSNILGKFK